jgi:hypothetical protein
MKDLQIAGVSLHAGREVQLPAQYQRYSICKPKALMDPGATGGSTITPGCEQRAHVPVTHFRSSSKKKQSLPEQSVTSEDMVSLQCRLQRL